MSAPCTVLMYHATPAHPNDGKGADTHYSVALDVFEQHLACLKQLGRSARSVETVPTHQANGEHPVGMTFDDGHRTNLDAARALAQYGWTGTFFVNPSTVGTPDFLSWEDMRIMADLGMSIQSHAQHHRYLDELSPSEQEQELATSKAHIEQHLGHRVTVFAPPGGRTNQHTATLAQQVGYECMCTSRVGLWQVHDANRWDVPRFAMLATTPLTQLQAWVKQSPLEINKQVMRYRLLRAMKSLMGNGGYERLRGAVLGAPKDY